MEKQPLLNTCINNLTMPETIDKIEKMISSKNKSYVVAVNVDVIMKIENDPYLKEIVDNADMVLVDGKTTCLDIKDVWETVEGKDIRF